MESKTSEMSLDEVLLSIKKMVIDEEPPVLELTEMVSEDGSIVSIKKKHNNDVKTENKSSDMSSFLKLIQEDVSEAAQEMAEMPAAAATHIEQPEEKATVNLKSEEKNPSLSENVLHELVREAITPLLKDWLEKNLSSVINKIVETEVKNFLYRDRKN